jgi:hypothetical protein
VTFSLLFFFANLLLRLLDLDAQLRVQNLEEYFRVNAFNAEYMAICDALDIGFSLFAFNSITITTIKMV